MEGKSDRLIVHTVHTDEGYTEVYFGRSWDDHPSVVGPPYEGSILFHRDGSFTYKLFNDDDEPVVVSVKGNRVVVIHGEDQAGQDELTAVSEGILFDSATVKA